jgi:hypothetical protein
MPTIQSHRVCVSRGQEYPGETYIDCSCGAEFNGEDLPTLLAFLSSHGIPQPDGGY